MKWDEKKERESTIINIELSYSPNFTQFYFYCLININKYINNKY